MPGSLAIDLLLIGSPIIYYGSELATYFTPTTEPPKDLFPLGKVPFPNLSARDSALTCHLPMPWGRSGLEFSQGIRNNSFERYLRLFGVTETVEVGLNQFSFHNSLSFMITEVYLYPIQQNIAIFDCFFS